MKLLGIRQIQYQVYKFEKIDQQHRKQVKKRSEKLCRSFLKKFKIYTTYVNFIKRLQL